MKIPSFQLERYFAKYEFSVKYLLCSSDCGGLNQQELVSLADAETKYLWENLSLGYTESLGHPLLRQEVAKMYRDISDSNVLMVVPEEGIFIALNSILEKGDHIICTFPGYQSLYQVAESLGCEVTKWFPDEKKGWKFDVDFIEQQIRPNTRMLVINFPHNPTGFLPTKEDYLKILEIAQKYELYVFSDEMYRFLELNEADRLPSACEVYKRVVSLSGMSKIFGMAGVRVGWLISRDTELFSKMAFFKDYTTICGNASGEILSIIALRAKERIVPNHLERIKNNLSILDNFFQKYQDKFDWVRPAAGTIAFPRLIQETSSFSFCQKIVNEAGIMILPSTVYDYDDHHFRLGFGRENMPEALAGLDEYLRNKK